MTPVRVFFPRFDQEELTRRLREQMVDLDQKLPLLRVVLFGSYARGNYTVSSDIDLLVLYKGEHQEDAFAVTKRTLDISGLEPHVYSEEEFDRVERRVARMTEGGIVLFAESR